MMPAGGVGQHVTQIRLSSHRPIPDNIVTPSAKRQIVADARDGIADDVFAGHQSPTKTIEQSGMRRRGQSTLLDHPPPGNVSSVNQLGIRVELPAHCRANAVRADKQIATQSLSIGEPGGNAVVVLLEFDQFDASANALFREGVVQHVVEPGPGRAELWHGKLGGDAAVARESHSPRNRDADGAIDPSAGGEKPFQHRRVNSEARASSLEFADRPFDYRHVATRAEQHVAREKPAQRAADDDGAGHFTHSQRLSRSPGPADRT